MKGQESVYLPHFTIGLNAFDAFRDVIGRYGNKIAAVHGEKAWNAAGRYVTQAVEKAGMTTTGEILYGHEATWSNVERLVADQRVRQSDVLLAVGGGKCVDTVKLAADLLRKPVFTIPTIASNCAPVTKLSIMYGEDGTFEKVKRLNSVPVHCFIHPGIILDAPIRYLRAGIGDAMAKHVESEWSAKAGEKLSFGSEFGILAGRLCFYPMLEFGKKAVEDAKAGIVSEELEKILLNIIITPGIVSVSVHSDYVGGIAHALFYGLTRRRQIEENYLHGDVVAYGTLVNLMVDRDWDKLEKTYRFNRSLGLPSCLKDLGLTLEDDLEDVLAAAVKNQELSHTPYLVTADLIQEAMRELESYRA